VADDLAERGFAAAAIHGDLGQGAREQALRAFRGGKVDVLVATDVAARGIDVDGVTHVVNYACPEDERTYLHRIGRTGRAGASGVAVTFVDWEDVTRWKTISNALGLDVLEPAETYSTSPHLFTELDIPEGTRGRLPRSERTRAGLNAEQLEDLGGREPAGGAGRSESRSVRDRDSARPAASRRRAGAGAPSSPAAGAARHTSEAAGSDAGSTAPQTTGSTAPRTTGSTAPRTTGPAAADTGADRADGAAPRRRRRRRVPGAEGHEAGAPRGDHAAGEPANGPEGSSAPTGAEPDGRSEDAPPRRRRRRSRPARSTTDTVPAAD